MVPPFELTILVDPRGGYTTGASIVAQVDSDLEIIGKKELKDCKVVVFGGTGMVGQTVSVLCSKAGAETTLCSRSQERAETVCKELNKIYGTACIPKAQGNEEERVTLCMDKDLIFTCGTAGVQILTIEMLKKLPRGKICADANAVPPLGIENIDPLWKAVESEEVKPGIFFYGALSIGDIKLKVEKLALQEMMEAAGFDTFSFVEFYDYAKEIILRRKKKKK
jgi:methylene-tetrahydromethanopterin dehydrogenase